MKKWLLAIHLFALAMLPALSRANEAPPAHAKVVVIPIHGPIDKPQLYVLRRGLKEAIDNKVDTIVLDMKTPGGSIAVTFEILEALGKFPGKTVTYIDDEAMSAGALIASGTDEIYFAPSAVIGAAAPVDSSGADIGSTMKAKVVSYLKARVRSITAGKGYRSEVISAMIDIDSEFKIGDEVIKGEDELLSLTAQEAMKKYGTPPVPLLGAGIAPDIDGLLDQIHGHGNWSATRLEVTWSENFAQYLTAIAPILMALGLVCLFIEFKTPGFGFFGIAGGLLLGAVFLGHSIAGLSGHEPMLFFALGVLLIVIEIFFFPGTVAFAIAGVVLMFGSLVWSMADLWPSEPVHFTADVFLQPLMNVAIGMILAIVIFALILRFLPRGGPWGNMVLTATVGGARGAMPPLIAADGLVESMVGQTGVTATALFPSGQVIVNGRRYEARVAMGSVAKDMPVIVTKHGGFGLEVEEMKS